MNEYEKFLKRKEVQSVNAGFTISKEDLNPNLFPFQRDIVAWALQKGKASVFTDCGSGKGQPYGSKVLTVNGWVNIEDLKIGDLAYGSDGNLHNVSGVFPKQEIDTYRFYYSDGTSLVFDKDHLHIVRTNNDRQRNKPWRVMSTTELISAGNLRYGEDGKSRNYDIPIVKPIKQVEVDHLITPYIIGVLLGDGGTRRAAVISSDDPEIIKRVERELPCGVSIRHKGGCDYAINGGLNGTKKNAFNEELNRLGLSGKYSYEKEIPGEYMIGSVQQRINLLRGLMDTDGYASNHGGTQHYYTTSQKLRDQVVELVQSLGGVPTKHEKESSYRDNNGDLVECRKCYSVAFSLKDICPFYLQRKAERWIPNPRDNGRWIDRIEYEKKQKTVCISVDSDDHSYVTENYVVTHNTIIQLEFADKVCKKTGGTALIVAPLSVAEQTKREGEKFGITAYVVRDQSEIRRGAINITNYEILDHFDADAFNCVVLDESSILKCFTSATRNELIDSFAGTPYKLCCTATPSPNDFTELGNHAEFMGIMSRTEMLATYFIHDGSDTSKWRLKGYGEEKFWEWVATWAICMRTPKDLGYSDDGYILPKLNIIEHTVPSEAGAYELFARRAETLSERREARKESQSNRILEAKKLVEESDEQWLVWCDYNSESDELHRAIGESVEVVGADSPEYKAKQAIDFVDGKIKCLVSKSSIYGMGLNFQNCHNIIYCGISDSFESFYQSVRRCWRYGQEHEVNAHIIISEKELNVLDNIKRKEAQMDEMQTNMISLMRDITMSEIQHTTRITTEYNGPKNIKMPSWLAG